MQCDQMQDMFYPGRDLGAMWSPRCTHFRVWAPTATRVRVHFYQSDGPEDRLPVRALAMNAEAKGVWHLAVEGNLHGCYYTYAVSFGNHTVETCDPYARAVGVNGNRAMVIDLASTDPEGWQEDVPPHAGRPITDSVIYEVHLRDISVHPSSGIRGKGQYAGLTETGTATKQGVPTGLDHVCQLGVTHVQLMPMFDYGSVDEGKPRDGQYNWGYDPVNFHVPEGSYSSDPHHGEVRIREVKELVMALHRRGLGVVMDVVYNHVYDAGQFCFNRIVPGYFSRQRQDGSLTNDSGCGNDTASERPMVRKFIVDSLCYWAEEYHMDGFRLDLAGLTDVVTIREAMAAVHRRCPHVIFYGEGWEMCTAPVKARLPMAVQANAHLLPQFGFFNDGIRDGLRGSVFFAQEQGFVSGAVTEKALLAKWYGGSPQSINYVSCHDNHTLFDRLATGAPNASFSELVAMNRLATAFVLTARGVPFFLAGEEMLRTKPDGKGGFDHNSYRSGDRVNAIRWDTLERPEYGALCRYYQGLIAFRKTHPVFREGRKEDIQLLETNEPHCVAFRVGTDGLAIFHAGQKNITLPLPDGQWQVFVDRQEAGNVPLRTCQKTMTVLPVSAQILIRKKDGIED